MRAEVRYFEWQDMNRDRAAAEDPGSMQLTFAAGPLGEPGEEIFQATVCTMRALAKMVGRDGVVLGRHLLIVEDIITERVEAVIEDRLRRLDGDSWSELAHKIGRIGLWEFEDYSPAS